MAFSRQRKPRRKQDHHFPSWHGAEVFCKAANCQQHAVCAEIRLRAAERRSTDRRHFGGWRRIRINGRILHRSRGPLQPVGIRREVLRDAQRAAEINNGHQAVRPRIRVDKFPRGFAGVRLIAEGHGRVVEEKDHVVPLCLCGSGHFRAGRKTGDALFFVVLKNAKIGLLQVVDVIALFVYDHGIDKNQARFLFDHRHRSAALRPAWRLLCGGFLPRRRRRRGLPAGRHARGKEKESGSPHLGPNLER